MDGTLGKISVFVGQESLSSIMETYKDKSFNPKDPAGFKIRRSILSPVGRDKSTTIS